MDIVEKYISSPNKRTYKRVVKEILRREGLEWDIVIEKDYRECVRYGYLDWNNPYQGAHFAGTSKWSYSRYRDIDKKIYRLAANLFY